jgi:hypothetical protein
MPLETDAEIAELLNETRVIAMVGASDRPDRASYGVMQFLQDHGYRVMPVNPQITGETVHGEFVWRDLSQIGEPIDMVDIFRRPQAAGECQVGLDAAGRHQRGGGRPRRGRGPEGRDGPLPEDRDRAVGIGAGQLVSLPSGERRYYPTVWSIVPKIGWCRVSSIQMRTVSPLVRNGVSGLPRRIVSTVRTSAMQL